MNESPVKSVSMLEDVACVTLLSVVLLMDLCNDLDLDLDPAEFLIFERKLFFMVDGLLCFVFFVLSVKSE